MKKLKLTLELLNSLPKNEPFATGVVLNTNDGTGVYMVDGEKYHNKPMIWIAVTGSIGDWVIYIHWQEHGYDFVRTNGDKISLKQNILNLVDCDDAVLARWRS